MSKIRLSFSQIPSFKKFLYLIVLATLLGFGNFAFSAYSENQKKPAESISTEIKILNSDKQARKKCCGEPAFNANEIYTLVGSYYSLKDGQESILMFNNKGPEPLVVSPVFFSLSGNRLELPAFTIPPTSYQEVDLRELLASHLPQFEEGSLQVTHQGMRLQLGAQFKILKQGMLFDEQFITPATRFPSSRMESVWWMPSSQSETKFILSNTTDATVTATVEVNGTAPQQKRPVTIELTPHETRVIDVIKDLVGRQNGILHQTGGISITHSSTPGAIMARLLISDKKTGFSTAAHFVDPTNFRSSKLNGGGLRLGSIGNDELEQVIVARNTGAEPAVVRGRIPYTNENNDVVMINIPDSQLGPNEVKTLDVKKAIRQANLPSNVTFAGLELEYTAAPGSVVMNALSVSRSNQQVFQVPLLDPEKMPSSAGGFPWKVDGDYTTVIFIKNESSTPKKYFAKLNYEGGKYVQEVKELKPGQTVAIDFKQLRDSQTPDSMGQIIPLNIERGQATWSMIGPENNTMSGRSEQVDTVRGISSTYACYNCCPDSRYTNGTTIPHPVEKDIGGQQAIKFVIQIVDCYNNITAGTDSGYNWSSSNTSVASINFLGEATAVNGGTANLTGYFTNEWWYGNYFACNSQSEEVSGTSEIRVKPGVLNVTANGATKISQVVGDTNIIHFVTPKGAANSQVTLTASLQYADTSVPSHIDWEGATESPSNPLQATLSKSTASKNIVKIKYRGSVIKELRVWVVWSEISSTSIALVIFPTNTGDPLGAAIGATGGYDFTHRIQPTEITDVNEANRPDFSGARTNPPGGTHPVYGVPLAGGANMKWDNSRQIRFKILNPNNISYLDTGFYDLGYPSNLLSYPASDVEGNDDSTTGDPENNDPYSNGGVLTGTDSPQFAVAHRAGVNGNTFEFRAHFREFTRLEIEGEWHRISDFYLWRIHFKFQKNNGFWTDAGTVKALDNAGF
ncbi:MAG TPA: hypothetical protein VK892_23260 [Pyrinomonadaceae bacterium]|nr:hypothetical protein [Pyrinomonadaceae bacterium]